MTTIHPLRSAIDEAIDEAHLVAWTAGYLTTDTQRKASR